MKEKGFYRLHKPPKSVRRLGTPISEWDAKSRAYYHRSLNRYLADPHRKMIHERIVETLRSGEIGTIDRFRVY